MPLFLGNDFNNNLVGSVFDDVMSADGGDDTVEGRGGADIMGGGAGFDTLVYGSSALGVNVSLTSGMGHFGDAEGDLFAGFEHITGSGDNDTLEGDGGINVLNGLGANDTLRGLGGADQLFGGFGRDDLDGGTGNDVVDGGAGNDVLAGGSGVDTILGGDGADVVTGGAGADILGGGFNADTVSYAGSAAGVTIYLPSGDAFGGDAQGDTLSGFENVTGSAERDIIFGDDAINILTGGAGDDDLYGADGGDTLWGGAGDDYMRGGAGGDHYDGGGGEDTVSYRFSASGVEVDLGLFTASGGDAEGDTIAQVHHLEGTGFGDNLAGDAFVNIFHGENGNDDLSGLDGNDQLFGQFGSDALDGGDGNDTLDGGAEADALLGGDGIDTVAYDGASERVRVALDGSFAGEGDSLGDLYFEVERVRGSAFGDVIRGDAGDNRLIGGGGNDTLQGRDGDDSMLGGIGADALTGGDGEDYFDYTSTAHGGDTIHDFATGADVLRFDDAGFGGLPLGGLAANRFATNLSGLATTGNHRFIYETDTGVLRYDSNGTGAGGVTVIATFTGAPALALGDFVIN